jgi:hypothetical protein
MLIKPDPFGAEGVEENVNLEGSLMSEKYRRLRVVEYILLLNVRTTVPTPEAEPAI